MNNSEPNTSSNHSVSDIAKVESGGRGHHLTGWWAEQFQNIEIYGPTVGVSKKMALIKEASIVGSLGRRLDGVPISKASE